MSNQKTSQLRRVSGSQLVYGDLIPLVDVSESTAPTGETKAISAGDLASYVVSGGFLEAFIPMHGYQSANGLVFDQYVAPVSNLNLRCYGEFPEVGTEFSLMVRAFVPASIYETSSFRAIFGIGESPTSLTSGSHTAYIGLENNDLIGYTNDGINKKKIPVTDFLYDYEDKVFESVLTRDSSGTLKLYLNSTLIGTLSGSATSISSSYVVMGNGHADAYNIDCTIYEAHIFNAALTLDKVKSMFYGGVKNSDTTLIASYTSPNLNPGPTQWLDSKGTNHILLPITGARASNPEKEFSLRFKSDGTSGFLGNGTERDILPDNYVLTDAFVYSTGSPLLSIGSTSSVAPIGASGINSWNNNRVPLTNAIYSRNNLQLLELGVAHTDKSIYVFYSASAAPCTFSFEGYISDYGPLTYSPPAPVIISSLYETATNSIAYSYQILATNYPIIYSSSNLPTGLSINNLTGLISGTPVATAGLYYVGLFAANYDATGSAIMTMSLAPAPTPTPTTTPTSTPTPTPTSTPTPTPSGTGPTPTPTPTATGGSTYNNRAIFGYGYNDISNFSITNLVSNTGVVATDTAGVGTSRRALAAAGYGGDKAIFGYGYTGIYVAITNLVSNAGVVATDTTGVGTARLALAAAGYGGDKAIFGYGNNSTGNLSMTNKVDNTGVVASDTVGVGTAREYIAAANYGGDKAIFGYGYTSGVVSMTNLVSNLGVVATDTTGVGTSRGYPAAAGYGGDKAIFGYGNTGIVTSITNLVSNTGVVATDTTGVGTLRTALAAAGYGVDKAIFGDGSTGAVTSITNLVSNVGVVATDTAGVGTARLSLAAASYS